MCELVHSGETNARAKQHRAWGPRLQTSVGQGVQHFMEVTMDDNRRDALTKEYGEVCSNFRTLTDIRFKLLGLLPIATAPATAFKGPPTDGVSFVFPLFGLIATIGLVTYNTRN